MRLRFYLFGLIFFGATLFGQDIKIIDSLNKTINSGAPDTLRIKALCDLSKEYSGTDNAKALQLAARAKSMSEAAGNKKQLAYSLLRIGSVYDYKSVWDTALTNYLNSLKIFEELKDKSGMAGCFQNIGVMYYYQLNFDKALEYYNKALDLRLLSGELNYAAKLYNNMGSVYRRQKKYDNALISYKKSLSIKEKQKDDRGISACYTNIAALYRYTGKYDSSLAYVNKSFKIDSAIGSDHDKASDFITRGDIYLFMNKVPEAKSDLMRCIEIAKKIDAPELLYNAYSDLAVIDTLLKDYRSALNDQFLVSQYKDAVISKEKATEIEKLQALYESEKKDSEIKMLNLDSANKEKQQRTLYIIIGLVGLLFVVSMIFYIRKRRDNTLLTKQKQEIINKTELLKEQAAQIARMQSQMNPHFMFNALNAIQQFVIGKNMSQSLNYLNDFARLMRVTLNNSEKELISIKEEVDFLRLYIRFEELRFENRFEFDLDVAPDIDTESVQLAPMVIQPFIENAVKHGLLPKKEKGKLSVSFSLGEKSLIVTVTDNGVGRITSAAIKNENPPLHESKGLKITEERVKVLCSKNGFVCENPIEIIDLADETGSPAGTQVKITLPLLEIF